MESTVCMKPFITPSSDGVHTLKGRVYLPAGKPRGIFHVVHGMTEHIARYDTFFREMAAEGFLCCGYDNLGHGYTAKNEEELGYIADRKGYDLLARDVRIFSDEVKATYGTDLPYILMGHSMGSFIVRLAVERYVHPSRLILMGTGSGRADLPLGLALIAIVRLFRGRHYRSAFVCELAFGGFNKRFGGGSPEDPSPWLTNDESVRQRYYDDPFCTFRFTLGAMGDLLHLMKLTNRPAWFRHLPKDLPVLLVSGADDPVGAYGKGVHQVEARLKKAGLSVECTLFRGGRHEILHDFTHESVVAEIRRFTSPVSPANTGKSGNPA